MDFFVGLLIGLVAGGAIVYVYKAKIQKKVEAGKQDLEELYAKAKEEIADLKKKVQ